MRDSAVIIILPGTKVKRFESIQDIMLRSRWMYGRRGVMDGSAMGGGHEERGEGEHVQCG